MKISPRIKKLRDQSLNAVEKISAERALLITRFYKSDDARELSAPVKRARERFVRLGMLSITITIPKK